MHLRVNNLSSSSHYKKKKCAPIIARHRFLFTSVKKIADKMEVDGDDGAPMRDIKMFGE
jgi:hypothetical protein